MNGATEENTSFPTIGEILNLLSEIVGLKEKQKGSSKLKRKLQYLAIEDDKVDPDTYEDILFRIVEEYDNVTDPLSCHWLSGSQIFHYLRAYQHFILHFPVYGLDENQINDMAYLYLLYISFKRFIWFKESFIELWFPEEGCQPKNLFDLCIARTKKAISDKSLSVYGFAKELFPELSKDDENLKNIISQLKKDWGLKSTSPQYQTFKDKIVEPLKKNHPEAALTLETDFLGWKWMASILNRMNLQPERVLRIIPESFYAINSNGIIEDYIPPSDYTLEDPALLFEISRISQQLLSQISSDEQYDNWQRLSLHTTYELPDPSQEDPQTIRDYCQNLAYRDGPSYSKLSRLAFEYYLKTDTSHIKDIFRSRYYHGLLKSSYKSSLNWLERQKEPNPELLYTHIDEEELQEWLSSWNDRNIDHTRIWSRYARTRLMMATSIREIETVRRLLESGADPLLVPKSRTDKPGDDSSVLLIVLQSLLECPIESFRGDYKRILNCILDSLDDHDRELVKEIIVKPTKIMHISPLSLALDMADPDILDRLLEYKPIMDEVLGADEYFPIYYAVTAYSRALKMHSFPVEKILEWFEKASFNSLCMVCPKSLIDGTMNHRKQDIIKAIQLYRKNLPSDPLVYRAMIKQLHLHGAQTNQLSHNGRFPLDMAFEIYNEFDDSNMLDILQEIGETKRALF